MNLLAQRDRDIFPLCRAAVSGVGKPDQEAR